MKRKTFRDLDAYKEAKKLVKEVCRLLKGFPKEEQYALCDQLRRAAISVTSNIAEGSGRVSYKEKIHFLEISYGSLMEVLSQMDIAMDLGYITEEEFNNFEVMEDKVGSLISDLRSYFGKKVSGGGLAADARLEVSRSARLAVRRDARLEVSDGTNQNSLTPNHNPLTPNL